MEMMAYLVMEASALITDVAGPLRRPRLGLLKAAASPAHRGPTLLAGDVRDGAGYAGAWAGDQLFL